MKALDQESTSMPMNDLGPFKNPDALWVNKHAPKLYVDLVGDEKTNREILSWVKHWDYCVFKKNPRVAQYKKGMNKVIPAYQLLSGLCVY